MRILPSKPFKKKKNKELDPGQEILLKKTIELVLSYNQKKKLKKRLSLLVKQKAKHSAGYFIA
jgi:hypothetical protein